MALEKRGYVMAGKWTPECTVENPEAGKLGFIARTEISSSSSKTTKLYVKTKAWFIQRRNRSNMHNHMHNHNENHKS